jgi:hypothetical protein
MEMMTDLTLISPNPSVLARLMYGSPIAPYDDQRGVPWILVIEAIKFKVVLRE